MRGAVSDEALHAVIERIAAMEALFDRLSDALRHDPEGLRRDAALRSAVHTLAQYLDSGDWLRDYELDEAGLLPAALKRGVLSQDGLYMLLDEIGDIRS